MPAPRPKQSVRGATAPARLDALHARYRVHDVRPLFSPEQRARLERLARPRALPRAANVAPRAAPQLGTFYRLRVPPDTDIVQLAADYATDPGVEYAEPNYTYRLFFTPGEPLFGSTGLWGQRFADLWGLHAIEADRAWDLSTGAGVVVAVLDTGLIAHPDITANLWTNPAEIPDNGVDDDGNELVDDVNGWHFLTTGGRAPSGALYDDIGHGTHVAGTIAAVGDNGIGVVGVAWQARIMPLGIFNLFGQTFSDFKAQALLYAVEHGAQVVNMSFGGRGESFLVRDMIDFAVASGVVVVAAAGNDGIDVKAIYPAGFENVIAVGAVDHVDGGAEFSNFGGKVDVVAPGGGDSGRPAYRPSDSVLSLATGGCNGAVPACLVDGRLGFVVGDPPIALMRLGGTSMAAAHVSGTAALIGSRHPEFSVDQVRQALRDGADDLGPVGRDAVYGYGRLNAARALALDGVAVARLHAPAQLSRTHGEPVTVVATVRGAGGGLPNWRLLFGRHLETPVQVAAGVGELEQVTVATIDTAPLDRGSYLLQLQVTAPGGVLASDSVTLTRLPARPYLRQLSDSAGAGMSLGANAWTDDGGTVVWSEQPSPGVQRVIAHDVTAGTNRTIAAFRFGSDLALPAPVPVDAAISGDGSTIEFSAPEDLSTSAAETTRPVQLFEFDSRSASLRQLSHVAGGQLSDFRGLRISASGDRIAFAAALPLDPAVGNSDGNREIFYWDRATNAFHQVTRTAGQPGAVLGDPPALAMSASGAAIAFVSSEDLDPSVGNAAHVAQLFHYDVAAARLRQLTRLPSSGSPLQVLDLPIAFSPDATRIAASINSLVVSDPATNQRTLVSIDTASGQVTSWLTLALRTAGLAQQFSRDGAALIFQADSARDAVFPVPPARGAPGGGIFHYELATGAVSTLSNLSSAFVPGTDGRLLLRTSLAAAGVDPEGTNDDGNAEVYLLDPETGGGLLRLRRGRLAGGGVRPDRFTFRGQLWAAAGAPLNPVSSGVSLTILGANGQLFRDTVPAGAVSAGGAGWRFSAPQAAGLRKLLLTSTDGVHYAFSAAGAAAAFDDLAVVGKSNGTSGTVNILTTNGSRSFAKTTITVGSKPQYLVVRDFGTSASNAAPDGKLDFAVTLKGSAQVRLYFGNGLGAFAADTHTYGADQDPIDITAGDFTGDSCTTDLAITNHGTLADGSARNLVTVLAGRCTGSAGSFGNAQAVVTFTEAGASPNLMARLQLDGSTGDDIVLTDVARNRTILLRNDTAVPGFPFFTKVGECTSNAAPQGVAAADFNDDGTDDWAVANKNTDIVQVFTGDGVGASCPGSTQIGNIQPAKKPVALAICDVTNAAGTGAPDGYNDLVILDQGDATVQANVVVFAGTGTGVFSKSPQPVTQISSGSTANAIACGLANTSDGLLDVGVTVQNTHTAHFFCNQGNGTFSTCSTQTGLSTPKSIVFTDLLADLTANDFAIANSGNASVFTSTAGPISILGYDFPVSILAGVFNSSLYDLAVAPSGANAAVFLMNNVAGAAGQNGLLFYQSNQGLANSPSGAANFPFWINAGDFDLNSHLDGVTANTFQGDVTVLLGLGSNMWQPAASFRAGSRPNSAAVADFDVDGRPDVAVADTLRDDVAILAGNGCPSSCPSCTTAPTVGCQASILTQCSAGTDACEFPAGTAPQWIQQGNLNGDCKPDIAVVNPVGTITLLLNTTNVCCSGCGPGPC
jgi:subtilisin family serine protease